MPLTDLENDLSGRAPVLKGSERVGAPLKWIQLADDRTDGAAIPEAL
jgi:hypothetical protein